MNWQDLEVYWKMPIADVLGMMYARYHSFDEIADALNTSRGTLGRWAYMCKSENPALDGDSPKAILVALAWRYQKRMKREDGAV